ncbi:hypothetical protein QOZ39_34250, partial [Pseudomonas aeruginosa]|uniref:hypothetical protein n=1 Tax=Pseudomonas aeruginosa TaxID=287 RepID=UPI00345848DF
IKMAPVVRETAARNLPFHLILTGQHNETFDELQRNFGLQEADLVLVGGGEAKDRISFAHWVRQALAAAKSSQAEEMWRKASVIVVHG